MPTLVSVNVGLDRTEFATVKAALLFRRDARTRPDMLEYVACDGGEFPMLDSAGIDTLLDRIEPFDAVAASPTTERS